MMLGEDEISLLERIVSLLKGIVTEMERYVKKQKEKSLWAKHPKP